ncbi:uncharacterized protein LOC116350809 [Contarinia nasturtii]|uniref:uncharacterized protein LOC116350809 n=1 Tax=Contarinia nasturtii TaxID=265458 RepID=UPI0012D38451|nr:uncharacterized protein LOC116350809 [Contarinia nasturtii]
MSFEGKVILITGASSGIGADASLHLASKGASVSIVGRNEKRLHEVAEKIKKSGFPVLSIIADVTKDAERIVNETIEHFGKLDVLVNNAGFGIQDNVATANISEFDRVFDTNIRGIITLSKLCVPHLEKTRGNIVNVSSVAGLRAFPNAMSYCMSKAALDQFTKCSALDLAPRGIRVNSINPASVRTNFLKALLGDKYSPELEEKAYNGRGSQYPVGRAGEVSDTSHAIAFLANQQSASFLTGIILSVDGGSLLIANLTINNQ